jgi:hypothetical protein
MSEGETNSILRELDTLRKENRDDHAALAKHAEHTNGTVAELVAWKIQVKTVLWIFGALIGTVVVPVLINLLNQLVNRHIG